jgi:hypothetical protein
MFPILSPKRFFRDPHGGWPAAAEKITVMITIPAMKSATPDGRRRAGCGRHHPITVVLTKRITQHFRHRFKKSLQGLDYIDLYKIAESKATSRWSWPTITGQPCVRPERSGRQKIHDRARLKRQLLKARR